MKTQTTLQEILRLLRNLIRSGVIVETDLDAGRCRVQTGGIVTDWLQWLTARAGRSRIDGHHWQDRSGCFACCDGDKSYYCGGQSNGDSFYRYR